MRVKYTYVGERAVRNFTEMFSVSIIRNLMRDDETYDGAYVHMENVPVTLYHICTRINLRNNLIREHPMIYAHRPRIPDFFFIKSNRT